MLTDTGILAQPITSARETVMRILAAEDNPVFESMPRAMLRKWGYDAVMAHDGNQAWQILGADDSRRAVVDWAMPGTDGVEVCRRLRPPTANRTSISCC